MKRLTNLWTSSLHLEIPHARHRCTYHVLPCGASLDVEDSDITPVMTRLSKPDKLRASALLIQEVAPLMDAAKGAEVLPAQETHASDDGLVDELKQMTKSDLKGLASQLGNEIDATATKNEVLEYLLSHLDEVRALNSTEDSSR